MGVDKDLSLSKSLTVEESHWSVPGILDLTVFHELFIVEGALF